MVKNCVTYLFCLDIWTWRTQTLTRLPTSETKRDDGAQWKKIALKFCSWLFSFSFTHCELQPCYFFLCLLFYMYFVLLMCVYCCRFCLFLWTFSLCFSLARKNKKVSFIFGFCSTMCTMPALSADRSVAENEKKVFFFDFFSTLLNIRLNRKLIQKKSKGKNRNTKSFLIFFFSVYLFYFLWQLSFLRERDKEFVFSYAISAGGLFASEFNAILIHTSWRWVNAAALRVICLAWKGMHLLPISKLLFRRNKYRWWSNISMFSLSYAKEFKTVESCVSFVYHIRLLKLFFCRWIFHSVALHECLATPWLFFNFS